MDVRWEGHPLRKDYPFRGYQIFTEPSRLIQHFWSKEKDDFRKTKTKQ